MALLGREVEDMGVVMWEFWGGRSRIWGCYVAVLGREVEDMGVVMWTGG